MSQDKIVALQDVRDRILGERYFAELEKIDAYAAQMPITNEISFSPACSSNPSKDEVMIAIVICEGPIGSRTPVNGFCISRAKWEELRDVCDRMFAAIAP